jgi:hypothetical protein
MNFKFLVNTITDWNEPPRARHQLAEALSQDHQVTFVSANRFGFIPAIKTVSVSENLTVIIPHFPVDSRVRYRIPLINKIYQNWLFKRIGKEYNDYIVINLISLHCISIIISDGLFITAMMTTYTYQLSIIRDLSSDITGNVKRQWHAGPFFAWQLLNSWLKN